MYVYNEEDFTDQLVEAGFRRIKRCNWNEITHIELTGVETTKDPKVDDGSN